MNIINKDTLKRSERPSTNENEGKAKRIIGPKVNKIFDEDKNELKEEGGMEYN